MTKARLVLLILATIAFSIAFAFGFNKGADFTDLGYLGLALYTGSYLVDGGRSTI